MEAGNVVKNTKINIKKGWVLGTIKVRMRVSNIFTGLNSDLEFSAIATNKSIDNINNYVKCGEDGAITVLGSISKTTQETFLRRPILSTRINPCKKILCTTNQGVSKLDFKDKKPIDECDYLFCVFLGERGRKAVENLEF